MTLYEIQGQQMSLFVEMDSMSEESVKKLHQAIQAYREQAETSNMKDLMMWLYDKYHYSVLCPDDFPMIAVPF